MHYPHQKTDLKVQIPLTRKKSVTIKELARELKASKISEYLKIILSYKKKTYNLRNPKVENNHICLLSVAQFQEKIDKYSSFFLIKNIFNLNG